MIGKLKGVVDSVYEDHLILDVHGVGYVVACSSRTLQKLPRPGEAAMLAIGNDSVIAAACASMRRCAAASAP